MHWKSRVYFSKFQNRTILFGLGFHTLNIVIIEKLNFSETGNAGMTKLDMQNRKIICKHHTEISVPVNDVARSYLITHIQSIVLRHFQNYYFYIEK